MREFTLTTFLLKYPESNLELTKLTATRTYAADAAGGKRWLSELISDGKLPAGYFYRFEAAGEFPEVRPGFCFNIAFHLFEGGKICPVRIWSREEREGSRSAAEAWTIDFNGLPGWSLMASLEPRWYRIPSTSSARFGAGMSKKDWHLRDRWKVAPQGLMLLREVIQQDSVADTCGVLRTR